ncbi:MAG: glycosyltransferase family 2 protein [Chloroflexi bacterium]|nr:glycosyltransferase family 2 protein [Chloroflexota bacterium]
MESNLQSPLALVIRAYNEAAHIGKLLEGVRQQTIRDVEVILVDSGSTDDTAAIAARYGAQVIAVAPGEFTFGRSLNRGVAAAHAEIVAIASAHVYPVYPDWLERLVTPFADPQVALTYGKQRPAPESHFSEARILARWFPDKSDLAQAHPFCNNANAAIRRSQWQRRPYDETLSGLEDLAWAHEAIQQGARLAYVSEAEVIHVHHETPRDVYNRYRREAMAYKRIFPHERFGLRHLLKLATVNIASDLLHAARQGALRRHAAGVFWFRWMQFWGAYQGYRQSGPLTWQLRQTFYYPQGMAAPPASPPRNIAPIQYNERE